MHRTERHGPDRPLQPHAILLCSAVAKMVASVATYPHEVVRTRLQTQRRLLLPSGAPRKRSGIIRTTRKIIHFEGWRGLYKGLSVNLIRTVPNSAVTMLTCVQNIYLRAHDVCCRFSNFRPSRSRVCLVYLQIRIVNAPPRGASDTAITVPSPLPGLLSPCPFTFGRLP
jgi:hypothetical protein